ncbi:hypothetical protein DENSPDRAFT_886773 [Dentipellis sp. KUC8613]|nr:hypothetical protein DENSPDRAFT_886773 [Dentipellis sp. KUC8613]
MTFGTSELRSAQSPIEPIAFDSATSRPPLFVAVAVAVVVVVAVDGCRLHLRFQRARRTFTHYIHAQRAPAASSKPPAAPIRPRRIQRSPAAFDTPLPRLIRPRRVQYAPAAFNTSPCIQRSPGAFDTPLPHPAPPRRVHAHAPAPRPASSVQRTRAASSAHAPVPRPASSTPPPSPVCPRHVQYASAASSAHAPTPRPVPTRRRRVQRTTRPRRVEYVPYDLCPSLIKCAFIASIALIALLLQPARVLYLG